MVYAAPCQKPRRKYTSSVCWIVSCLMGSGKIAPRKVLLLGRRNPPRRRGGELEEQGRKRPGRVRRGSNVSRFPWSSAHPAASMSMGPHAPSVTCHSWPMARWCGGSVGYLYAALLCSLETTTVHMAEVVFVRFSGRPGGSLDLSHTEIQCTQVGMCRETTPFTRKQ